jgi:hypothetical protein
VANTSEMASVRYLADDVDCAVDFYTTHLGFTLGLNATPAFAEVTRGPLRNRPAAEAGSRPAAAVWPNCALSA